MPNDSRIGSSGGVPGFSRRGFLGLAGGAAAAFALGGCGNESTAPSAGTSSPGSASLEGARLRVSVYSKNHASAPLFWQKFAPPGVTVEPKIFTSGSEMNRALEKGDLDFALFGVYNGLIDKEQGLGSKIISMCSQKGIGLVSRTDRGIETVADLKGKRVAVPPPGVQVLVLTTLLEQAGLRLDRDVTSVPLGYADHVTALQRGDVDAYAGTEPPVTTSVVSGIGKRLVDPYTTPLGDFNTAIWASPAMLAKPEVVRAAAKMQRDAAEYLTPGGRNDPAVWKDLLVTQFGYSEPVYAEVLSNIGAVWRFDDVRKKQFEAAGEAMRKSGVLTQDPDLDAIYALDYAPTS